MTPEQRDSFLERGRAIEALFATPAKFDWLIPLCPDLPSTIAALELGELTAKTNPASTFWRH